MAPQIHSVKSYRLSFVRLAMLLAWGILPLLSGVVSAAEPTAPKRVLVLYYYGKDYPANVEFEQGFQTALRSASAGMAVEYFAEYLEPNRFPGESQSLALRDYLHRKYADYKIDVVIAQTDMPLNFLLSYRADLFPGTPLVFFARKQPKISDQTFGAELTGVVAANSYKNTVNLALTLHPATEQVLIVIGEPNDDKTLEAIVREELREFESRVTLTYLANLPMDELTARVKSAPERSVILYVRHSQDKPGNILSSRQVLALIAQSANVPVYGIASGYLGNGIVGGYIFRHEDVGARLAEIALRIAKGERPQGIPVNENVTAPMFDSRQLQRLNIDQNRLPPGSVVRFREPSFWDVYKWRIIGVISLCIAEAMLIFALLLYRARRKQMEMGLRESEELHRVTISNISDAVFITNDYGAFTYICSNVNVIFGYTREETRDLGSITRLLGVKLFDPDELAAVGEIRNIEQEITDRTGTRRTLLTHVKRVSVQRGTTLYVCRDITERKQAEDKLKESESQFRLLTESIPQLVWTCLPDGSGDFCNQRWLDYTGMTMEEARGRGWQTILHPSDRERTLRAHQQASSEGRGYELEVRLRSASGTYRWFLSRTQPMQDSTGCIVKWYGTNTDIEDRKQVEEALRNSEDELRKSNTRIEDLAGRLIEAQEEERKSIARELHDDVNQQVVALAIGISRLKRLFPDGDDSIHEQIANLRERTKWLSKRIRQVSHELHSSILQHVGLTAALQSYCAEFSEREGIEVALDVQDDIEGIPEDVALCLYRVAQESLHNAARHSGAKRATVVLAGVNGSLELQVADQGIGFDLDQVKERRGLGLISMEERVRLLHGSFELISQRDVGTELKVRISLGNGIGEK